MEFADPSEEMLIEYLYRLSDVVQIVGYILTVASLIFERPDRRFDGDRLIYRS